MKKGIILLVFWGLCNGVISQQVTNYTQYTLNRFALNPAVAGLKPCGESQIGYRQQWVGFEGAPRIVFASFNSRVNKDDKYPKNFHGFGMNITSDRSGFTDNTAFKIAYAYHLKLWTNYHISFGIFAGLQSFSQSYQSINIPNKALDPAIDSEVQRRLVLPEISPGAFLYNRNAFVGLSFSQLYPTKYNVIGTGDYRMTAHYFLSSGYRIRGRKIDAIPSFLLSFSPFISPTLDLTLTLDYEQKIALGLGSKYLNSGYVTLQLRLAKGIAIGYAYEYALTEIINTSPATHEIIINLGNCTSAGRKQDFVCPAYQ